MSSEFIPETPKLEIIPQDLKDKWGAAQACSTALALFDQGMFSARHHQFVGQTAAFLGKLHEQAVEEALKHPQAHMIKELNEVLKNRKAKSNGEEKAATEEH